MHYFYILHSDTLDRYYTGETSNLDVRLDLHNFHHFKNSFTKSASDWKIVLKKECKNRNKSLYLEKFVKRMKSKEFIEKVIITPEILDDILNKK